MSSTLKINGYKSFACPLASAPIQCTCIHPPSIHGPECLTSLHYCPDQLSALLPVLSCLPPIRSPSTHPPRVHCPECLTCPKYGPKLHSASPPVLPSHRQCPTSHSHDAHSPALSCVSRIPFYAAQRLPDCLLLLFVCLAASHDTAPSLEISSSQYVLTYITT